ncbi:MAG: alpha/beta hydrolase [Chloroflexota bacterium]
MRTEDVTFYSERQRLSALWRTPDQRTGPLRAVVQGPGWLGLKDGELYVRYHQALVEAGFGVLIFDYRGFGDSGGDPTHFSCRNQLQDLLNAVTYLTTRDDVNADCLGVFGSGGTGAGNAVLLAEADPRIRAAVAQLPVADGADWLHRMRSEYEWLALLEALAQDRKQRVVTGKSRLVNPKEDIMVPTPERRATNMKADVDSRVPIAVELAAVDDILGYRPIEAAARLKTPLMVIAVENDATTPTDHAVRVYEAARGPKVLLMQRHTSHYAAYDKYWTATTPKIVDWFDRYLRSGGVEVRSSTGKDEVSAWLAEE